MLSFSTTPGLQGSALAFAAAAGVAGLAIGVPLGAGDTAEQQGAAAERCFRLHRAVAAWAATARTHGVDEACAQHVIIFTMIVGISLMKLTHFLFPELRRRLETVPY